MLQRTKKSEGKVFQTKESKGKIGRRKRGAGWVEKGMGERGHKQTAPSPRPDAGRLR